ncbi:MAG TPA: hypothetical protein VIF32_00025 [Gemmatimonadaceae bacterium]|jgi:hypothetical protein
MTEQSGYGSYGALGEPSIALRIVDGRRLEKKFRDVLKPGGVMCDSQGQAHQLPRYFYEIPSWDVALELQLSEHFALWEFIHTDVHEAEPLRTFPRYVPCAITLLALGLEQFRGAVGEFVHIAANGGYRSPCHVLSVHATPHAWATAVNLYKIGETMLDERDALEHFADIAYRSMPGVYVRPFGNRPGSTDDHLHLDFGYVVAVPRGAPFETYNPKLDVEPL